MVFGLKRERERESTEKLKDTAASLPALNGRRNDGRQKKQQNRNRKREVVSLFSSPLLWWTTILGKAQRLIMWIVSSNQSTYIQIHTPCRKWLCFFFRLKTLFIAKIIDWFIYCLILFPLQSFRPLLTELNIMAKKDEVVFKEDSWNDLRYLGRMFSR